MAIDDLWISAYYNIGKTTKRKTFNGKTEKKVGKIGSPD